MRQHLTKVALFAALALPSSAFAITCDEIVNMVRVNVPSSIVVSLQRAYPCIRADLEQQSVALADHLAELHS